MWASFPGPGSPWFLANRYPCFHQFRGGKGVAVFLGFYDSPVPLGRRTVLLRLGHRLRDPPYSLHRFLLHDHCPGGGAIMACEYNPIAVAGSLATALFIYHNHRKNISTLLHKTDS